MFDASSVDRLQDMHESCSRIATYTAGLDRETFFQTKVVHDATMWNLLIIGEAANHLPESITAAFPDVPWPQLVGLRNRLAHEYNALDDDTIWEIVSHGVSELDEQLRNLLDRYEVEGLSNG